MRSWAKTGGVDTETECGSPPPNATKRCRGVHPAFQITACIPLNFYLVHGPDHTDEAKVVELVASMSSLCLDEACEAREAIGMTPE